MKKLFIIGLITIMSAVNIVSCSENKTTVSETKPTTVQAQTEEKTDEKDNKEEKKETKELSDSDIDNIIKDADKNANLVAKEIHLTLKLDDIKEDGKYSYNKNIAIFKELWKRSKQCEDKLIAATENNLEDTVAEIIETIPCSDLRVVYNIYQQEGVDSNPFEPRKGDYLQSLITYRQQLVQSNLKYADEDVMARVQSIIFENGTDDIESLFSTSDMGDLMGYANGSDLPALNISQLFAEYDQADGDPNVSQEQVPQENIQDKVQDALGSKKVGDMTLDELYDNLAELEAQRFYESLSPLERFEYDLWSIKGPF